jgi:hypothetical protein
VKSHAPEIDFQAEALPFVAAALAGSAPETVTPVRA